MNVWLVSPAWRRYPVTRLALAQRRWLCDQLATRGHEAQSVIVADDENLDIARGFGFHTVEMGNHDLGLKFNAGYQYAAIQGADVLVHVGSDDWVHPDAFLILDTVDLQNPPAPTPMPGETVVWRVAPQVVAQRQLTLVDLEAGTLRRCVVNSHRGAIPWLIPRAALENIGFAPIKPGLMRGIDGALVRGMTVRPNWMVRDAGEDWCVDFKTQTNLTSYAQTTQLIGVGSENTDPWHCLAGAYPTRLVDMARDLAMTEVAA